jgi:hypothetical protein
MTAAPSLGGAAQDGRAHELRGLGQRRVLQPGEGETGRLDGVERGAVAVAAHDQPVEPVHPVLQPGRARVIGAHMLDEQQLAAGAQHPPQLTQPRDWSSTPHRTSVDTAMS